MTTEISEIVEDFSGLLPWKDVPVKDCKIYSHYSMFVYNYFYLLVYFIGLNFTHLDNPPFTDF